MLKAATNFVKTGSCVKEQDLIPAFTEGNAPEYAWPDVRLGTGQPDFASSPGRGMALRKPRKELDVPKLFIEDAVLCVYHCSSKCFAVVCRFKSLVVQVTIKAPRFSTWFGSEICSCSQIQIKAFGQEPECIESATEQGLASYSHTPECLLCRSCQSCTLLCLACLLISGIPRHSGFTQEKILCWGLTTSVIQYFVWLFILAQLCSFAIFFLMLLQLEIKGLYSSKPSCSWVFQGAFPESGLHQIRSLKIIYCSIFTSATNTHH